MYLFILKKETILEGDLANTYKRFYEKKVANFFSKLF